MADGVDLHTHPSDSEVEPAAHTAVVQHESECYWLQQQARVKAIRTQMIAGQSLGVRGYNELFGYICAYQSDFGNLVWQALLQLWQSYPSRNQMLQGVAKSGLAGLPALCHAAWLAPKRHSTQTGIASSTSQPCSY